MQHSKHGQTFESVYEDSSETNDNGAFHSGGKITMQHGLERGRGNNLSHTCVPALATKLRRTRHLDPTDPIVVSTVDGDKALVELRCAAKTLSQVSTFHFLQH